MSKIEDVVKLGPVIPVLALTLPNKVNMCHVRCMLVV